MIVAAFAGVALLAAWAVVATQWAIRTDRRDVFLVALVARQHVALRRAERVVTAMGKEVERAWATVVQVSGALGGSEH